MKVDSGGEHVLPSNAPLALMSAARRSRRVPSEQISQSSQAQRIAEDVEGVSEDEAPRRTKVKKEKKSTRQRAEAIEEHENAGPAEQETTSEDVFDKYKYLNQPLNAESGIRIRGFAGDWGTARDAFRIDAVEMAKAVAGSMAEFCQGKEDQTVCIFHYCYNRTNASSGYGRSRQSHEISARSRPVLPSSPASSRGGSPKSQDRRKHSKCPCIFF